ncbi:cell division protein FtsQ/DivIB [Pseudonocardia sp. KRD291]|uniref:cell division protein FtsQ/DivIB n=1 Tax=Pseudonocardia sp. KRD291 TaxID=2792007 RepID=UPI001C4A2696|nr:FtsQ-type POTRA domain-containing protein [Pseudonocardia sp. KRD291]MBW0102612.1 FtsQ-type POTRA domain-containing protein [Pseudonocardia sp. KRD291]
MTGPGGRGGRRSGRDASAGARKAAPGTRKKSAPGAEAAPGQETAPGPEVVGEKSPRTPEQQRRAAERARTLRERRAAERAGSGAEGSGGDRSGADRSAAEKSARPSTPRPTRAARPPAERARYRRRRLVGGLVVAAVLLAALAAGAWWALGRFGPAVSEVRVDGNRAVTAADVRAAAGVDPGTSLASVDTGGVRARVAGIPGVASVEVGRSWPDALTVTVTERAPVAVADAPGGRRLVDATGLAYRAAPPQAPRLPLLALPRVAPDDPATAAAVELLAALPGPVRDQVDTVVLGAGGTTLELNLTEDRRVLWGRWARTADTTADTAAKTAIIGPLLSREGSVYDVSSPALPTVRR